MRWNLAVGSVLMLAAAGCAAEGPAAARDRDVTGTWRQSGDLRDALRGDGHIHLGTYSLQQAGAAFAGTGQQSGLCNTDSTSYTGPLADPAPFPVMNGVVTGDLVTFETPICRFEGTFEDGRRNRITGTATCAYDRDGVNYTFTGVWQADRLK